ncbi:hypothetical protein NST62_07305 [Ureibacillus sp. FSL K6-8385]|uniref:DUF2157 domain-containing protein n=1 Tax=Ureibacillus terrenus TaxID=118246 RepID=A0A540V6G1_9BACL|nr:hypothetical protein [Ureibacillus terrenus]MED3661541.1 hypothetical protein [Ureibacillus terrenus]MED3764009.1 hypothetical protein [Ureibacillus terrenus]TQE91773.1 hypothetical protein FKZ59_03365 [Ureibacillus terrenus]
MDDPKKEIILNEILFWKRHKLLPEHYCDFLMALYTEGEGVGLQDQIRSGNSIWGKEKRKRAAFSLLTMVLAAALLVFLFRMTSYVPVALGIVGGITVLLIVYAFKLVEKQDLIAPILQVAAALLILGISVKVSLVYFEHNNVMLYALLIANCLLWLVAGVKLKLLYFSISGVLGILILAGYLLLFL